MSGSSTPLSLTSVIDDVDPITGSLVSGASTNDTDLTVSVDLSGTGAQEGDTIQLSDGTSSPLGSAYVLTAADISNGTATVQTGLLSDGSTYNLTASLNGSPASNSFVLTIDTTPPLATSALTLDPASDTGVLGDGITSVALPTLTGTAEPGSTVNLYDGNVLIGTGAADPTTGAWSITATTPLTENTNSLTATATDAAGNVSPASAVLTVNLDTTPPLATSALTLDPASDTGVLGDGITSVALPTLTGTAEPGSTVNLYDGNVLIGTGAADPTTGAWSITATTPLTENTNSLTATATDAAGNVSPASAVLTVNLDTTPPLATSALTLDPASDTGVLGDGITSVALPTLTGTAEPGSTVNLYDGNVLIGTGAADPTTGAWSITATTPLTENTNSLTATATDAAGNVSPASAVLTVNLDTTPPLATSALTLDPASDTGVLGDGITSVALPTLTGTAEPGSTVNLYDGNVLIGTGAADPTTGAWSITATTPLTENTNSLTATATDAAGNVSPASAVLTVNLDTTAPIITASLAGGGNLYTAALTGTAEESGTITVSNGGTVLGTTTAAPDGSWSYTPTGLTDGSYTLTAAETDAAGNTSTTSVSFVLPTRVTAITAAPSVAGPLGVGRSVVFTLTTSEGVTVSGNPVLTLSNGANASYDATNSTPTSLLFDYTVAAGQDSTDLTVGSLTMNGATIAVPATTEFAAATSYAAGSNPYSVAVADVNGDGHPDLVVTNLNDGSGSGVNVLLNNGSGVFLPATSYAAGSNPYSVAVADVNGDGHPDLVVTNLNGGSGSGVNVLLNNGSGVFLPATSYAAGSNPRSVAVADVNGDGHPDLVVTNLNGGSGSGVNVLLNNGSGVFLPATSYAAGSNPYSVAVADVNGDGHPDLVVTNLNGGSGSGVNVLLNNGSGVFLPATSYAAGSNPYSVAVADVNGDGHPDLVVTNLNGGSGSGVNVLLNNGSGVFLPATSYAAGSNPRSVAVADVNGDGHPDLVVTNLNDGSGSGVNVLLNNGSGVFLPATSYAAGSNPYSVAVADVNGDGHPDLVVTNLNGGSGSGVNVLLNSTQSAGTFAATSASSAPGTSTGLVIDTTPPTVTAALVADTGSSATDGVTSNPSLSGTAEAGGTVTISSGATLLGTTTAAQDGSWSYTPTSLTDGNYTLTAAETDAAGNTGTAPVSFILETTAPPSPAISSPALTNVAAPVLTGTAETGDTVTVLVGGATYTTVTSANGWTLDLSTATPTSGMLTLDTNGPNTVSASAVDPAGNAAPTTATQTLTIDTTAPVAPAISSPALTNVAAPVLTGTAETGDTVTVLVGGATYTTVASASGWSLDLSTATPASGTLALDTNGPNTVSASAVDPAGNAASTSATQTLTIDTTAPVAPAISSPALTNVAASVLTGTAETGDTVTVLVGGATYTTVASASGWSLDLSTATPASGTLALDTNGPNTVSASAVDPAGNAASTSATQTLTIDTTAPVAPAKPGLALASDSGLPGDGVTNVSTPTVIGTAQPGNTVKLYDTDGTSVLGTTVADNAGNYSIASSNLGQGVHSLTVRATDAAGNVSTASAAVSLTIDSMALAPQILAVGSSSGAQTGLTNVATPTLTGTAEPGSRITLYEGETPLGTATVIQDGTWSFTAGTLAEGLHQITASVADRAGNISPQSQLFALTIDTIPPNVTAALLNDTGSSASDRITADATLTGSGDPDAMVTIGEGTATLGTTIADAQGHWTFAPTGLALGVHNLVASETDAAGNTSTAQIGLRLDPQSAAAPTDFITVSPRNIGLVRFFDSVAGTQFYTSSLSEYNAILANRPDLKQEGNDLNALNPNTIATDSNAVPVYRFFDSTYGTHFFTASTEERDDVIATRPDMKFEGVGFFEHTTQQAGDTAVYRFFDSHNGTHFYTTNETEKASILTNRPDLISEGIGFYAPKLG